MKKEQWEYIANNWASTDPIVQEQVGKIKDEDELFIRDLEQQIEERDKKIQELNQQNIDLNKTNMSLFLRLTDPKLAREAEELEKEKEPKIPKIDYYKSFVLG